MKDFAEQVKKAIEDLKRPYFSPAMKRAKALRARIERRQNELNEKIEELDIEYNRLSHLLDDLDPYFNG